MALLGCSGVPDGVIDGVGVTDGGSLVVDAGSPVVDAGSPVVDAGSPVVDGGACVAEGVLQLSGIAESQVSATQLAALRALATKVDLVKARFWEQGLYSLVLRRPSCLPAEAELKLDDTQGALAGAKSLLTRLRPALGFDATNDLSNLSVRFDEALVSPRGTRFRRIDLRQTYPNGPVDGGVVLTFVDEHLASIDGKVMARLPNRPDAGFPAPNLAQPTWATPHDMVDGELVVQRLADLTRPPTPPTAGLANTARYPTRVQQLGTSVYALHEPGRLHLYNAAVTDGGVIGFTTQACPTCFDAQPPVQPAQASAAYVEQSIYFAARQVAALRDYGAQLFPPPINPPVLLVAGCNTITASGIFEAGSASAAACGASLPATIEGVPSEQYPIIKLRGTGQVLVAHEYGHFLDHTWNYLGGKFLDSKCTGSGPLNVLTDNREWLAELFVSVWSNVSWGAGLYPNTGSVVTTIEVEHSDPASLLTHPHRNDCSDANKYALVVPGAQALRELALNKNAAPSARWSTPQGPLADATAARAAVLEAYFFTLKHMHADASLPQVFDRFEQYYRVFHGADAARYASEVFAHHALD